MQISSLNSPNIKNIAFKKVKLDKEKINQILEKNNDNLSMSEKVNKFKDDVARIKNNVRNETVVVGAGLFIASMIKGKHYVDATSKTAIDLGGKVLSAATKAGGTIVNGAIKAVNNTFKKDIELKDFNSISKGISEKAHNIATEFGNGKNNDFVNSIKNISDYWCKDAEKSEQVQKFVTDKLDIKNYSGLATATVAGAGGLALSNIGSDVIENSLDNKEIVEKFNTLFNSDLTDNQADDSYKYFQNLYTKSNKSDNKENFKNLDINFNIDNDIEDADGE